MLARIASLAFLSLALAAPAGAQNADAGTAREILDRANTIDAFTAEDLPVVDTELRPDGLLNGDAGFGGSLDGGDVYQDSVGSTSVTTNRVERTSPVGRRYEKAFPEIAPTSPRDAEARATIARELAGLGVRLDWRRHGFEELTDYRARAEKARSIAALGVRIDWRRKAYWELADMECQIRTAKELEALGEVVPWERLACRELVELKARIMNGRSPEKRKP